MRKHRSSDKICLALFAAINIFATFYIFILKGGPGVTTENVPALFLFMSIPILLMSMAILFLFIDGSKVPTIEYQKRAKFDRFVLLGLFLFVVNISYLGFYLTAGDNIDRIIRFALSYPLLSGLILVLFAVLLIYQLFQRPVTMNEIPMFPINRKKNND